VKILVDNALSPLLAELLSSQGIDAVHLRDILPVDASDFVVFDLAQSEGRIILSADTDFGAILANRNESHPSFVLLRHDTPSLPQQQVLLVLKILEHAKNDLQSGCIVSVNRGHARIRQLPIRS